MRKMIFVVAIMVAMAVSAQNKKNNNNKERVRFAVELNCQSCVNNITKNIPFEKGITNLECSLQGQWVDVEYRRDKTSIEKITEAFEKVGKKAVVMDQAAEENKKPEFN